MGNYYSGMMNNKDGYGELRHARTKGSKNGISNTPGYVAVGEKARGPYEKSKMYARQNDRNPRNKQQTYLRQNSRNPLQKYKAVYDKVGQVTREYGPKTAAVIAKNAKETSKNAMLIGKDFIRGARLLGGNVAKDLHNGAKAINNYAKSIPNRIKEAREDYKKNPEKYNYPNYFNKHTGQIELAKKVVQIGGKVGKKINNAYENYRHGAPKETNLMRNYWKEYGGILGSNYDGDNGTERAMEKAKKITNENKEENRLRDKFIKAEDHMKSTQKEYDNAVSKKDFDAIERLEGKLNRATDRYLRAQTDYYSYRDRPSWRKYK